MPSPDEVKRTVAESEWAKFGLTQPATVASSGGASPAESGAGYGFGAPADSLFADQQGALGLTDRRWWEANFFLKQPVLFGTWDGVFTSVMVNIFGVIVFLRMGWIVGEAGVGYAVLALLLCAGLALVPVLSAVGICERCQIQSGGVYFLVSHILGAQIGGAVGLLYSFGQAVATALVAVGFGESMAHLLGTDNGIVIRLISIAILILLFAINIAGVKWVVKLQLALLALLFLAVLDLFFGSFFRYDPDYGVVGYSTENFRNNTDKDFTKGQTFFTVFGILFSNFIGVLAGVNMSGDLKDPSQNIPLGELAAVGTSTGFCFLVIMVLGGSCSRDFLLNDTMIAEKVAATRILFLGGLYISSLSSILGSLYGAPRVLQSIAAENVVPLIKPLEIGRGPNKVPVLGTVALTVVSLLFVLVGKLNTLALIATMPFLVTYAFVNYAYVSLAMTFDLQQQRLVQTGAGGVTASYGSMGHLKAAASGGGGDLDALFPERTTKPLLGGGGSPQTVPDDPETGDTTKQHGTETEALAEDAKKPSAARPAIIGQPQSWYSIFCNRWVALVGALANIFIMFLISLSLATCHLLALLAIYLYIGQACPGVFPGISEFSVGHSVRVVVAQWRDRGGGGVGTDEEVVVAPLHPGVDTFAARLTDDNADYAARKQYHQTQTQHLDDFD